MRKKKRNWNKTAALGKSHENLMQKKISLTVTFKQKMYKIRLFINRDLSECMLTMFRKEI